MTVDLDETDLLVAGENSGFHIFCPGRLSVRSVSPVTRSREGHQSLRHPSRKPSVCYLFSHRTSGACFRARLMAFNMASYSCAPCAKEAPANFVSLYAAAFLGKCLLTQAGSAAKQVRSVVSCFFLLVKLGRPHQISIAGRFELSPAYRLTSMRWIIAEKSPSLWFFKPVRRSRCHASTGYHCCVDTPLRRCRERQYPLVPR